MVQVYTSTHSYPYSLPAVTLAYFLRYPNPYSLHVTSTDTISRRFDPSTQRLFTSRLHVKKSRLPSAVVRLLGKGAVGAADDGSTQSFVLETTCVDVREGWMEAESRNLDWRGVLSVVEQGRYERPANTMAGASAEEAASLAAKDEKTMVSVSVTLKSHIGEQLRKRRARWGEQASEMVGAVSSSGSSGDEEPAPRKGWFTAWSSGAIRTAIEKISLQRTERSQPKAQQGMMVVLERLRKGGLVGVLEGMRLDREFHPV
nr:hypothetical protein B0A51_08898 [Rachicladosporium sp. CCFEE 5018]